MSPARRRTVLFVVCAAVLLAAGYAWDYTSAYNRFYDPEPSLDRETVHLNFNSRVLHYTNLAQPAQCRRELVARLGQQIVYVRGLLPGLSPDSRLGAEREISQAERVIAGQGLAAAPNPAPGTPPPPPDRP